MPSNQHPSQSVKPNQAQGLQRGPTVSRPAAAALDPAKEIADQTRVRIRGLAALALRAQANSLPALARQLLAGSQTSRD